MNKIILWCLCLCCFIAGAQTIPVETAAKNSTNQFKNVNHNSRSDTLNVLSYTLKLDMQDFAGQQISGSCHIKMLSLMNNVATVNLDLLQLTVDSIVYGNNLLSYLYNDTLLKIQLPAAVNTGDSVNLTVYYHGHPQGDPSGWGGFYYSNGYAFNLGVGFDADPHNYARVWYPCFDNFVERATYEFFITTQSIHKAVCNGELAGVDTNISSVRVWHWVMNHEIPSYLSCVAVSAYQTVHQNFTGLQGNIPVELYAVAADTTSMKNSFVHLQDCFNIFENRFGPYFWNKVGYVLVPFSSGAMEHASCIAYPKAAVTGGSTAYEAELMAHELSHHWFGDLVTCKTAEDMWLNEGWASYCSFIFTEGLYGRTAYKNSVRDNHANMLQFAHYSEGGYQPVSGIPHNLTYGDHVYRKGADMVHTLRSYLGDTLFFQGIQTYLYNHRFDDVSSDDLMNGLSNFSGINLQSFFNNWIYAGGWPHFSLESYSVSGTAPNVNITLNIRQKLTGATNYYSNVPLEVKFMDDNWQSTVITIPVTGPLTSTTQSLPFVPTYISVNYDEKISDANVSEEKLIKTSGVQNYSAGKFTVNVNQVTDSVLLRVQHAFTKPDTSLITGPYQLSPNHYWHVEGLKLQNLNATATIKYDGRTSVLSGTNYSDNLLFSSGNTEDSVVLMHRSNPQQPWQIFPYYSKNTSGNLNDKFGLIIIDSLLAGDYVLAMGPSPASAVNKKLKQESSVYPNPATNELFYLPAENLLNQNIELSISDLNGKIIKTTLHKAGNKITRIITNDLANGEYLLIEKAGNSLLTYKIIIQNER